VLTSVMILSESMTIFFSPIVALFCSISTSSELIKMEQLTNATVTGLLNHG
jgi:hypothetical protein